MHRFLFASLCMLGLLAAPLAEAATPIAAPRILSRAQWGADESFLTNIQNGEVIPSVSGVGEIGEASIRAEECRQYQKLYPEEFETVRTVTHNTLGEQLRWPQRYSPRVKLLVVHHTAIKVTGDTRPPIERMRALYEYHANKEGWGDIGYHYVVDEQGNIYEGRAGGKGVVGGHIYCANVGTIGIALMGNFEEEEPTQEQLRSLKWLLGWLAQEHNINLQARVQYHGKLLPTISGHKDVGKTKCPGYYVYEVLNQIRSHVIARKFGSLIVSPARREYRDRTTERLASRIAATATPQQPLLSPRGSTELSGRPGAHIAFQIEYRAGAAVVPRRARLAEVDRSQNRLELYQVINGRDVLVRKELISPQTLQPGETMILSLKAQLPLQARTYTLNIGGITYTLRAEASRVHAEPVTIRNPATPQGVVAADQVGGPSDQRIRVAHIMQNASTKNRIRIRLSYAGDTATITTNTLALINNIPVGKTAIKLAKQGNTCLVEAGGLRMNAQSVRIDPGSGISTITSWNRLLNRYRGVLECRIIHDELVLINELPLEQYLAGVAEEPDSEPYEKQRAFAIAARSYAAHYMDPLQRKFPQMPYDGDDNPAHFQMYGGIFFEEKNPRWVVAVQSTEGQVIMRKGAVVKTPYFSSNDGRTRSPEERGWQRFPFAEVFQSKPDPWCEGMSLNGHGVGMSGCGAKGQANEGKSAEEILRYYYPYTEIRKLE